MLNSKGKKILFAALFPLSKQCKEKGAAAEVLNVYTERFQGNLTGVIIWKVQ